MARNGADSALLAVEPPKVVRTRAEIATAARDNKDTDRARFTDELGISRLNALI